MANTPTNETIAPDRRRFSGRSRWLWLVGGAIVLAGVAVLAGSLINSSSAEEEPGPRSLNTAEVVTADLVELKTLSGTLGRQAGDAVSAARSGTITALPERGDVVTRGGTLFEIDSEPVLLLQGTEPLYRDITLADETGLVSDLSGPITKLPAVGDTIESGQTLFEVDGEPVLLLDGVITAYRDIGLADVDTDLTSGNSGSVTRLPKEDATIRQGETLFRLDDVPVVLMYGNQPATRDLKEGAEGDDVLQLEQALVDLGYATTEELAVDGIYNDVTAGFVEEWQNDTGVQTDGIVNLGEVQFLAGPVTVDTLEVANNDSVSAADVIAKVQVATPISGEDVYLLEEALVDFDYATEDDLDVDGLFTLETAEVVKEWQKDTGAEVDGVVNLGEVQFLLGPVGVVEVPAAVRQPANAGPIITVVDRLGTNGVDVLQLEQNLAAMGFDAGGALTVDTVMTEQSVTAIIEWQLATGQTPDGVVNLGEVVFIDGDVRVASLLSSLGASVGPGTPILQITGNDVSVTVKVPAEDQGITAIGDAVIVEMPDEERVPGTVTEVATVATATQDGSTFFEVTVVIDDPSAAGGLDEAPVTVDVVSDSADGVIAVPITALLAVREGGYAVEVVNPDGTTTLVGVETGFYADGLVEVTNASLAEGSKVVTP